MKPWEPLGKAKTPDGSILELLRHDQDFVIRVDGWELMTSRMHASEEAMMALACANPAPGARVLVGGLGMGYTSRAALTLLPERSSMVIAELSPIVVEWNRGPLGPLADHPLDDPRTEVVIGDVTKVIQRDTEGYDAILLDVDNGPTSLTDRSNRWLYTPGGLGAVHEALRPGGGVAIWSIGDEPSFERRLSRAGFEPSTHRIRARGNRGPWHVVFVGKKKR